MITLPSHWASLTCLLLVGCGAELVVPPAPGGRTQPPPLNSGTVAVVGAHIVPMTAEEVLRDHTLVIVDGLITAVGPVDETDVPDEAAVVDGAGLWLLPGLIDMHAHVRREDLPAYRRAGITMIRNMWGTAAVSALKEEVSTGADHPTLYSAAPGLDGNPPVWQGSIVVTETDAARREVRRLDAEGWDFIKVYNRLSRDVYDAILAEAAAKELPVVGHIPLSAAVGGGFDPRHSSIEHLTGFAESVAGGRAPAGWLTFDADAAAAAAEDLARKGTWMCPTLVVLRHLADTRLSTDEATLARAHQLRAVAALHQAGVPLLAGTDAGLDLVPAGASLAAEVGLFVEAGLSRFEALRTATVEPARFLGVSDQVGTIEVGKRGDVLLLSENPLEGLAGLATPVGLIQRGKRLF